MSSSILAEGTPFARPRRTLHAERITLAHGAGGKAMRDLIEDVFVGTFDNPHLHELDDQARLPLDAIAKGGDQLAFTTDSYVVDPLFFPGGDIGELAITGTVNDLAVSGATPHYLTCGMIIEEGLEVEALRRVVASMKRTADAAGVAIVTGDTKVVHRGAADKLFINTAGVGVIAAGRKLHASTIRPGDVLLVNGALGDHGAAIVDARGEYAMQNTIESDCQPLSGLIETMLNACPDLRCMRDATRGGVATVANEFAQASHTAIRLHERSLPVRDAVRGMCEILGLDPLYLANEGKLMAIAPAAQAQPLLEAMRAHHAGRDSAIVGEVHPAPAGRVILETGFGGDRVLDVLIGDQLPRIC
ncbi:MAG: hydrogenase expression/formation protein HypE [Pseudomonadota bacterium]